ncbi:MAG: hypothetical protein FWE05_02410 [Defluviitaleaceae bacterium]|nr:hypothetical protein [Defluviitaleaceae bacterium]
MDEMITHLNVMLDGLKKKEQALTEILAISENQKTVIESELPLDAARQLVFEMNDGKQAAIQVVKDCDNMFEAMLKDIGAELEATQDRYTPQVKVLQEHIRRVMALDVKIRLAEEENNRLLDTKRETPSVPMHPLPQGSIKPRVSIQTNSASVIKAYKEGRNFKG